MCNKLILRKEQCSILIDARVDFVADYILNNPKFLHKQRAGELSISLVEEIERRFNVIVSPRQIRRYIEKARKKIQKTAQVNIEEKLERHRINLISLLKRSQDCGDLKLEHSILKDIAQLEGLYPETLIKFQDYIIIKDLDPSRLTDRQLDRIINGEDPAYVLQSPME